MYANFYRDTADMSRRNEFVALQEIRNWNVDTVVRVLEKNGLRECAATVRKRGITGDILLDLTEITLAGWKRDLNLSSIRKLCAFVQELNKDPVKHRLTENELNEAPQDAPLPVKKEHSMRSMPRARSGSNSSHSSWGSDFDDDLDDSHPGKENGVKRSDPVHALSVSPKPAARVDRTSPRPSRGINKITIPQSFNVKPPVIATKPKGLAKLPSHLISNKSEQLKNSKPEENSVTSIAETEPSEEKKTQPSNSIPRPSVPLCPPAVKPSYAVPPVKPNLPKPPGNMQENSRVENLINNLNFNVMDEEEYLYSLDGDMYPEITTTTTTTKFEEHLLNVGAKLVFPPPREVESQEETYDVCQNRLPSTTDYESDEYTSIKENETGIAPDSSEDYLLPVSKPTPTFQCARNLPAPASPEPEAKPPPLPAKPRPLLPDVVTPVRRTPSPSKPRSEDSGSSGDGVTGRIGGLFRIKRDAKGPLLYNLVNRLGTEMADAAAGMKQRILHPIRRLLSRYDDVLPPEGEDLDRASLGELSSLNRATPHMAGGSFSWKLFSLLSLDKMSVMERVGPPASRSDVPVQPGMVIRRAASFNVATRKEKSFSVTGIHYSPSAPTPGPRTFTFTKKAPSPELKKTVTPPVPNHKPPPPPPVEQRTVPVCSTQGRPLPQPPISDSGQRGGSQRKADSRPPITSMPWYHNVDRLKAMGMLRNGEDGAFLIRPSSQVKNPLTLTLWYNGRVYNISVRHRPDGRYALGFEKANEQSFSTIEEMVVNYQSEKLVLYSGGEQTGTTVLTTTPRKDSSK